MSKTVKAVTYLQVVVDRVSGDGSPWSLKVARATTKQPPHPLGGAVIVKVSVNIPVSLFEPVVIPEFQVQIPDDLGVNGDAAYGGRGAE